MKLYSVHDMKAGYYSSPVVHRSNGEAIRAFETSCKDPNLMLNKFPADFTLAILGTYDVDTGTIVPYDKITPLVNGADYLEKPPTKE